MKSLLTTTTLLFSCFFALAQNNIPDVLHYDISINDINFTTRSISGQCNLLFKPDSGSTQTISLSLLKLTVDSIIAPNGNPLSYSYNDTTLLITLQNVLTAPDSSDLTIYYHGIPKTDPSGWGGFYFSSVYAFNMGVGFGSNPHNFGKAWFPCNDTFTDKATYSFHITTAGTDKAFCNGTLQSSVPLPGGNYQWNWEMNDPIPTYLASIAVAPYYTLQRNYQGIPVEIACLPSDTNDIIGTFAHLDTVIGFFIDAYGPYPFDKVGYCVIPFNSGAMEHATSIHIGKAFINGTLSYETLWAHELSHMWWGDHVTCDSEGEMWLNEGFASFNEAYVTEMLYGKSAYQDWIRSNHRKVLQSAHIIDNGYYPMTNIPHDITYGETVYKKGASVAHTLRNYMGDSLFFNGCKDYMLNKGNGNANNYDLRDELSNSSGISMNRFFDDWIFTPGFPHFSIDSVNVIYGGLDHYFIHVRQKTKGNNHLYSMPIDITLSDGINDTTVTFLSDSLTNVFHIGLAWSPTWFSIDRYNKMSDAISDYERKIFLTGVTSMPETNTILNVQATGNDTSIVRIEHHFVAPDGFKNPGSGISVSDYHYWSIDGIFKNNFLSKITFNYNGSTNTSIGNLDNTLITGTEDSLVLLYRASCSDDWQVVTSLIQNAGNKFDKIGNFVVDTLKKGEYTLGYRDFTTGLNTPTNKADRSLNIWPNPSNENVTMLFKSGTDNGKYMVSICDLTGKIVMNNPIRPNERMTWSPGKQHRGTFIVSILNDKTEIINQLIQIIN